MNSYSRFYFKGEGILIGQLKSTKKKERILAYCGGFIEGKGYCGHTPLIKGLNLTCNICNYLIWNEEGCNTCSKGCNRS